MECLLNDKNQPSHLQDFHKLFPIDRKTKVKE